MSWLVVRADGGPELGLGHLVRCRAVADAWIAQGGQACFVTRSPEVLAAVAGRSLEVVALPAGEPRRLAAEDLRATAAAAQARGAGFVLVDHYAATGEDFAVLRARGLALAVLDDLADRDLSAVSWLLNPSPGAQGASYPPDARCVRLLGPEFAPLREAFAQARAGLARRFEPSDRRVLVTLGGGTSAQLGASIAAELARSSLGLRVRLVGTEAAPRGVEALPSVGDMAGLMAWADLAVAAGGVTSLELSSLAVPMLLTVLSPDQEPNVAALVERGAARALGRWSEEATKSRARDLSEELLSDPAARERLAAAAAAVTDGEGARRVAQSLLSTFGAARP